MLLLITHTLNTTGEVLLCHFRTQSVTYTCRWAMSLSMVTSCLTCRKRLWLLSTMLSRMSKDTCCIDASVGLALTKPAIWWKNMENKKKSCGNCKRKCSYSCLKKISGKTTDRQRQIQNLLDEDRGEVLPWNYPMIHEFHETRQSVCHDHIAPEEWGHTQEEERQISIQTHRNIKICTEI